MHARSHALILATTNPKPRNSYLALHPGLLTKLGWVHHGLPGWGQPAGGPEGIPSPEFFLDAESLVACSSMVVNLSVLEQGFSFRR